MGEEFPENLRIAVSSLINTVVNKMVQAEDQDGVEEFVREQGIRSTSDADIRQYCQDKADEIWKPWESLPLPKSLNDGINALQQAKDRITNSDVVDLKSVKTFSADALVQQYMDDFRINITGWSGNTIKAVRNNYLAQWGRMVSLQANTLQTLILLSQAYKKHLETAQQNIVDLVTAAEQVVESYSASSTSGGADGKNATFNILIAVGGFFAATGGWVAIAGAIAAGGLTISKDIYKVPNEEEEHPLGGDSISQIWQNTVNGTQKLREQFTRSEQQLADMCAEFYGALGEPVDLDKDGDGHAVTKPAYELIRALPVGDTSAVERPDDDYSEPDPVH